MRTCKNCGCYLPDNWITCPACFTNINEQPKTEKVIYKETEPRESLHFTVCRVDLYHKNNTKSSNLFASYDNAVKFAHHMTCRADVAVVVVTDIKSRKVIEKFSRKGY